jgi:hypothetical protein
MMAMVAGHAWFILPANHGLPKLGLLSSCQNLAQCLLQICDLVT